MPKGRRRLFVTGHGRHPPAPRSGPAVPIPSVPVPGVPIPGFPVPTVSGLAIAAGGAIRDMVGDYAVADGLGAAMAGRATGYTAVYTIEIILLLGTLVVLGPLVGRNRTDASTPGSARFGLQEFPT